VPELLLTRHFILKTLYVVEEDSNAPTYPRDKGLTLGKPRATLDPTDLSRSIRPPPRDHDDNTLKTRTWQGTP